jgi:hypothetical protein
MANNSKDFSILLTKVTTNNSKKDISMVSGLNKTVQLVEQACKVNQGELMADFFFGSNFYQYKFTGRVNPSMLQAMLANSVQYALPNLLNVTVKLVEATDDVMTFDITFTTSNSVNTQINAQCTIEVPLQ